MILPKTLIESRIPPHLSTKSLAYFSSMFIDRFPLLYGKAWWPNHCQLSYSIKCPIVIKVSAAPIFYTVTWCLEISTTLELELSASCSRFLHLRRRKTSFSTFSHSTIFFHSYSIKSPVVMGDVSATPIFKSKLWSLELTITLEVFGRPDSSINLIPSPYTSSKNKANLFICILSLNHIFAFIFHQIPHCYCGCLCNSNSALS